MKRKLVAIVCGVAGGTAYNLADFYLWFFPSGLLRNAVSTAFGGPLPDWIEITLFVTALALSALAAVLSYMFALHLISKRTAAGGAPLCPNCHYTLHSDTSRCPECGWRGQNATKDA